MTPNASVEANPGSSGEGSPRVIRLRDACVDIWTVSLTCSENEFEQAHGILSPDEAQRASRIRFDPMRRAFVITRAALRCLLGCYLDRAPAEILFTYESQGKPRLCGNAGISFSTTRSGDRAAFAFCTSAAVGIDMERYRTIPNMDRVAERMFSPGEIQQIRSLAPQQRQRAFLACWTRKEAYAKATGEGILTPFHRFSVDANPDELKPQIGFEGTPSTDWILHDLRLGDEWVSALAYRGAERDLSILDARSINQLLAMNAARQPVPAPQSA